MRLVKRIEPSVKQANGTFIAYGVFHCDFCNREVKRVYSNGIRQESCGCEHKRKIEERRRKRLEETPDKVVDDLNDKFLGPKDKERRRIVLRRPRRIDRRRDDLYRYANKNCKKCKGTGYTVCSCVKNKKKMSNLHKFIVKYASPACIKCLGTGIIAWESLKRGLTSKIDNPVICDCVVKHLEKGGGLAIGLTAEKTLKYLGAPIDRLKK